MSETFSWNIPEYNGFSLSHFMTMYHVVRSYFPRLAFRIVREMIEDLLLARCQFQMAADLVLEVT